MYNNEGFEWWGGGENGEKRKWGVSWEWCGKIRVLLKWGRKGGYKQKK